MKGQNVEISVEFAWDRGSLFTITVRDGSGRLLDTFDKPIPPEIRRKYGHFVPLALTFLRSIIR